MHTDQPLDVTLIQPSTPPDTHTSHPLNSFCISTSHSHISADAEVHSLPGSDTSSFFRGGGCEGTAEALAVTVVVAMVEAEGVGCLFFF